MKRIYKKGRCRYCGETGHTKRNCPKRAADEEAAAAQPTGANGGESQANSAAPVPQAPTEINLDLSEPPLSTTDDSEQVLPSPVRPPKLPLKRKFSKHHEKIASGSSNPPGSSQPARNPLTNPMQGATQGNATRLANFMKFVPTSRFKAPRNKK
ncbi:hypothetical protein Ahy_A02g005426 [Arachis hypogaea]|uniref:CCHC-type domain-containing protein n=1 Tax=Arachis hypogaea TaxID=3818 RepID=A0A445E6Y7_ARAHY|nr:hypothetical protein Ahy_A02g005426 [Arachis hypogaea]